MPKILTDTYRNATFFVPYTDDKSEGFFVKPVTETDLLKIRIDAAKEAGADNDLADVIARRLVLQRHVQSWQGFFDVAGNEIPCTPEAIKEVCECDPAFADGMAMRVRSVARIGELEEQKN